MKEIFEFVSKNLTNPLLITLIVLVVVFFYFTKDGWNKMISTLNFLPFMEMFKRHPRITYDQLYFHDVFRILDDAAQYNYVFMTHGEEDWTKSKIYQEFINIKMDNTKINMKAILDVAKANPKMNDIELKNAVFNCFANFNKTVDERLIRRFTEKGMSHKDARSVVNKFLIIRQRAMYRYKKCIDRMFAMQFVTRNQDRIYDIFNVVMYEVDDMVTDSIRTFESVNGSFFHLEYDEE